MWLFQVPQKMALMHRFYIFKRFVTIHQFMVLNYVLLVSLTFQKLICPWYCLHEVSRIKNYNMVVASNGIIFIVQFVKLVKLVKNLKGMSTHTDKIDLTRLLIFLKIEK
jgi:hypothetical protein